MMTLSRWSVAAVLAGAMLSFSIAALAAEEGAPGQGASKALAPPADEPEQPAGALQKMPDDRPALKDSDEGGPPFRKGAGRAMGNGLGRPGGPGGPGRKGPPDPAARPGRGGGLGRQGPPMGRPLGPPRWPHQDWTTLEKNDPEMYKLLQQEFELERRTQELAMQFRRAPQTQREAVKKEIEKAVNDLFEVRQQRRQLEIKRLDEELQRLRDEIERRRKAREKLVEKRVQELLGQQEDVGF
jgi:hypothetical protein